MKAEQKMYVTHKETGRKVFCTVGAFPSGMVLVRFFVPTSIYISSPDLCDEYFLKTMEQEDFKKRTMLVYYLVHPSYMLGTSFPLTESKGTFEMAEKLINQFELKSL